MQNPYMSKGEFEYHYNDFLEGYYGDAAEYIAEYHTITKKMINETMAKKGHLIHWFGTDENFDFKYNRATQSYDMTYINQINDKTQQNCYFGPRFVRSNDRIWREGYQKCIYLKMGLVQQNEAYLFKSF